MVSLPSFPSSRSCIGIPHRHAGTGDIDLTPGIKARVRVVACERAALRYVPGPADR